MNSYNNNNMNCEKMCCCIVEKEIVCENGEIIIDIFEEVCNGRNCNFGEKVNIGKDCENVIIEIFESIIEGEIGKCSHCGEMDIIGLDCCENVCVECLEKYGDCINGVRNYYEGYICSCEVELCMDTDDYCKRGDCEKCIECEYYFESDFYCVNGGDIMCCDCLSSIETEDSEDVCEGCDCNGEVISDRGDILYRFDSGTLCNDCM